jgi:hypothetical protein
MYIWRFSNLNVWRFDLKIDLYRLKEHSTSTEVNGAYFIFDVSENFRNYQKFNIH